MDTGVAIFPTRDAIGPAEMANHGTDRPHPPVLVGGNEPVERALDRYEAAIAEFNGE